MEESYQIQNLKEGELGNIIRVNREKKVPNSHSAVFPHELPFHLIRAFSDKVISSLSSMCEIEGVKVVKFSNDMVVLVTVSKDYLDYVSKMVKTLSAYCTLSKGLHLLKKVLIRCW